MSKTNEICNVQITLLFEQARAKLDIINQEEKVKLDILKHDVSKKKKDIVVELAENLEDKVEQTDTICQIIVDRLEDIVNDRFIRQCLSEKYKQKHRVENAKKQKKNTPQEESKLAVLTPLNQELENDNKIIIIDTDDTTFDQRNDDEPSRVTKETSSTINNDSLGEIGPRPQHHQQQQELKRQTDTNNKLQCPKFSDCPYYLDKCYENLELKEALKKATTFETADKVLPLSLPLSSAFSDNNIDKSNNIISFEFSRSNRELQIPLTEIFKNTGDSSEVWLCGKINTKTREVIDFNFGRLNHQQQQPYDDNIDSNNGDGTSE